MTRKSLSYYEKKYSLLVDRKGIDSNEFARAMYLQMSSGLAVPDPSQEAYRAQPAWSNSRLGSIKEKLIGIQRPKPVKAFAIGSIVHQQVLQPELCDWDDLIIAPALRRDILGMVEALKEAAGDLSGMELERYHLWTDPATGAPCKCQIDIKEGDQIIDLKTTSAKHQQGFLDAIVDYDYARQAAYYMDGTGANFFRIIGVQKFYPYQVFTVDFNRSAAPIEQARQRYRFLLRKAVAGGFGYG